MPRVARKRSRAERQVIIVLTLTGDVFAAYDAARRVIDAGILQDAMDPGPYFVITNVEVK